MPLRAVEPPEAVQRAAASHVHELATPRGIFPALRDVVREDLALLAPHRMYTLGLDAIAEGGLDRATESGWRYLVADRDRIVASAELAGPAGESPLINGGPFVASTAEAIEAIEKLPEVAEADFEMRLLKVPALYVVAVWLVGRDRRLVVPLAPAPAFVEAGRAYSEEDFMAALREPAREVARFTGASGG